MDKKPIKMFTVHYEDGTTESFSGSLGFVGGYDTKHKNEKGSQWESVTVHHASVATYHGDWKAAPSG